ncbi:MAG: DUF167 domain-containing protein [Thermodesulfovibrionales bacterium]|nr:DUF167 domain-containing protein [Thermodesulfovibrionales bacterium]
MIRKNNEFKTINVRVIPKARHKGIIAIDGEIYKIGLHSPPVDGKANDELIEFLSDYFQVSKSNVTIIMGLTSRNKVIQIRI